MSDRSRRFELREKTSQAHASLDSMIGPFDTVASYRNYLTGMAAFRRAVERQLAEAARPAELAAWTPERFSDLIEADMRDLGLPSPQAPRSKPASPQSVEDHLGILYVLEGSALGSRLLYKRAQALGYDANFGARHLAAQAAPGDRWPSFVTLLETIGEIDMNHVAASARATFALAETAFRQDIHEPA